MIISKSFNSLIKINSLLDKKDFWTKNLLFNKFKKELNKSHNILLIFDISKLLPINNSSIGFTSLQLNKIQEKFYMSLNFAEKKNDNYQIQQENIINEFSFTNIISTKHNILLDKCS